MTMGELKGKILLVTSAVIAVLLVAGCTVGGYLLGDMLQQTTGQMLVAYDWNMIKIAITVAMGVLALLLSVPGVITARQVSRMYDVSRKYARWSVGSIIAGVVMLLVAAAAVFGVCYEINEMQLLIQMLLEMENVLLIEIGAGVVTLLLCVALMLPLMLSLRVRDCVGALNRKKRARSYEGD